MKRENTETEKLRTRFTSIVDTFLQDLSDLAEEAREQAYEIATDTSGLTDPLGHPIIDAEQANTVHLALQVSYLLDSVISSLADSKTLAEYIMSSSSQEEDVLTEDSQDILDPVEDRSSTILSEIWDLRKDKSKRSI